MRNNSFRNNHYGRFNGSRQNNYRQCQFTPSYDQEQNNYRGYHPPNQYQNYNNYMQEEATSRNLSVNNQYPPFVPNNFSNPPPYYNNVGPFRQQFPDPSIIDLLGMQSNFENNINKEKNGIKIYRKYLEHSEVLLDANEEYKNVLTKCENSFIIRNVVSRSNNMIMDISKTLSLSKISFKEFIDICKGLKKSEENVVNAINWIQKYRRESKENFEFILQGAMAFFIMILTRKNVDVNLVRRLTNIVTRLIEYLGCRNNEYKDALLKMVNDFGIFYCLIKPYDFNGDLLMRWDKSIQKGLYKLDKAFKVLLSKNEDQMRIIYDKLFGKNCMDNSFSNIISSNININNVEIAKLLNQDTVDKFELFTIKCENMNNMIKNWLNNGCNDNQRNIQNLVNQPINISHENKDTYEENKKKDNRNWFEKQFCPSYSSLFMVNENNVQFQPIDPSEYDYIECASEVSDNIKNLFEGYKIFLDGNNDNLQPIDTNGYETFNKLMKLKYRLREEVKEKAYEENKVYSEYFIHDFDEIEYKEPVEVEKNSNGTVGSHDFARFLSSGRTL
ncbi:Hypothetical protein SRAE_2000317900 [Strongyloides ratti]|uniref:Uncharacterized protein n=1 Tax=Strongyloides ratti TaxID=34506 RepID=A0A090LFH8_STRRB|nr:Hypothetical protein SRAE_2000317900 [Strongyloides ratti]CEF68522.1 Hypothetical protein SRAE_2000317900 [Strongyloides ratti]